MALSLEITHINQPSPNPDNEIEQLKGIWVNSNAPWSYTFDEVINMIERSKSRPDPLQFVVKVNKAMVPVNMILRNGRKYLKTASDSGSTHHLLALPSFNYSASS